MSKRSRKIADRDRALGVLVGGASRILQAHHGEESEFSAEENEVTVVLVAHSVARLETPLFSPLYRVFRDVSPGCSQTRPARAIVRESALTVLKERLAVEDRCFLSPVLHSRMVRTTIWKGRRRESITLGLDVLRSYLAGAALPLLLQTFAEDARAGVSGQVTVRGPIRSWIKLALVA